MENSGRKRRRGPYKRKLCEEDFTPKLQDGDECDNLQLDGDCFNVKDESIYCVPEPVPSTSRGNETPSNRHTVLETDTSAIDIVSIIVACIC